MKKHQHHFKVMDTKDKNGRIGQIIKFDCGCIGQFEVNEKNYGKNKKT